MKEADLKRSVRDYLEYGTNQGKWYADSLFSGEAIEVRGETRRRIRGCRAGTADFMVLQADDLWDGVHATRIPACRIMYIELKGEKRKQRPEQEAFQKLIESQGASYHIIRDVDDLIKLLGG